MTISIFGRALGESLPLSLAVFTPAFLAALDILGGPGRSCSEFSRPRDGAPLCQAPATSNETAWWACFISVCSSLVLRLAPMGWCTALQAAAPCTLGQAPAKSLTPPCYPAAPPFRDSAGDLQGRYTVELQACLWLRALCLFRLLLCLQPCQNACLARLLRFASYRLSLFAKYPTLPVSRVGLKTLSKPA